MSVEDEYNLPFIDDNDTFDLPVPMAPTPITENIHTDFDREATPAELDSLVTSNPDYNYKWDSGYNPFDNEQESEVEIEDPVLDEIRPRTMLQQVVENENALYKGDWAPYLTKAMFLADLLFNSRELWFSQIQKSALLKYAHDVGGKDVPSLSTLEKLQEKLSKSFGKPTLEKKTRNHSIYYINDIGMILAKKDMANPLVHPYMQFYPEEHKIYSQAWHGNKWLVDLPDDLLTPMVIHPIT
ncbi:hypothetical protein Clacol_007935 [Clathrus columnatus]|uniref:Uncharacterized protein n=1 Tax=Clathrus columnatus TaxID=1419009 RepID=A0AAV5AGB8_9AGAM|nr:hypothetical protein Clacol_007935 [Clathrus columnatus]